MSRKIVCWIIGLPVMMLCMASCVVQPDNYRFTGIALQRVDIGDTTMAGRALYMVIATVEVNDWHLGSVFAQAVGTNGGSCEQVDSIVIADDAGKNINALFSPLDSCSGNAVGNDLVALNPANDSTRWVWAFLHEGLRDIRHRYMRGGKGFSSPCLLIKTDGQPLPASITLVFAGRRIPGAVDNTPKNYQLRSELKPRRRADNTYIWQK